MGKLVRKDSELTDRLKTFLGQLESKCNADSAEDLYLKGAAIAMKSQSLSFFSALPVSSYGKLAKPCRDDLPSRIDPAKFLSNALKEMDIRREALAAHDPDLSGFVPSQHVQKIYAGTPTTYCTRNENGDIFNLGKRHPNLLAREALRQAAELDSDSLLERINYAIMAYINLDTTIYEIYSRVKDCYDAQDKNLGNIDSYHKFAELFDPFSRHFRPELDFKYKEKRITPELVQSLLS